MRPDPAFTGEIVVDETGKFCGCCEILHDGVVKCYSGEGCKINQYKYLVGAVTQESGGHSLAFFKLSNGPKQEPLFYEIHDASPADSYWGTMCSFGGFAAQGNARVTLEELPYSEEEAGRIKAQFREVDCGVNYNGEMIAEVGEWQKKILVIWAK